MVDQATGHQVPSPKWRKAQDSRAIIMKTCWEPPFNVHAPSSNKSSGPVEQLMEAATVVDIDRIPAAAEGLSYRVTLLS